MNVQASDGSWCHANHLAAVEAELRSDRQFLVIESIHLSDMPEGVVSDISVQSWAINLGLTDELDHVQGNRVVTGAPLQSMAVLTTTETTGMPDIPLELVEAVKQVDAMATEVLMAALDRTQNERAEIALATGLSERHVVAAAIAVLQKRGVLTAEHGRQVVRDLVDA